MSDIAKMFSQNAPYTAPGTHEYNTQLPLGEELQFRKWLSDNRVQFNPDQTVTDYDMRGFWRGLQQGDPHARTGLNANDGQIHFSDYWKTPGHQSFSQESQWATPVAPQWNEQDQLVSPGGKILFDERSPQGSTLDQLLGGRR